MKFRRTWLGLFIAVSVILTFFLFQSFQFGPAAEPSQHTDASWPTKRALWRKAREVSRMLLVYGTQAPEAVSTYKTFAVEHAKRLRWLEGIPTPDSLVTMEDLKTVPLFLIGTPSSNSILKKVADSILPRIDGSRFIFGESNYSDPQDVYVLSIYPGPVERSLQVSIISGNSDRAVADFLVKSYRGPSRAGDFRVYRNGQMTALGFFSQQGTGPWRIDSALTRHFDPAKESITQAPHYRFFYHGNGHPETRIREFAARQEKRATALLNRLRTAATNTEPFPRIEYHLYESLEDKGLMTGNTDLSHFNLEKWQVHAVFNDDLMGGDFYSDAKMIFSRYVGKPKSQPLRDGVGIYFSESWGEKGYRYWASFFHQTDNVSRLEELLDTSNYDRQSYLFMRPLAGSFVEFLVSKYSWKSFIELYKIWPETGLPETDATGFTRARLEAGWRSHLESMKSEFTFPARANAEIELPKFQKGFCYAHEGYQIYNGYLSRKSFESLKKLRSLGTEWISLSPFGYLRNPTKPDNFRYSFGAGSENDESLVVAALHARRLGMGVMLKPHVLLSGPHWGWPGDIKMTTDGDWRKFFKHYYEWIRHYALLAEMYEMDLFCLGVELMETTRDRDEEWRKIISKVRQIYRGPIVYAANWWQEFEHVTFWDDLDYIGLNSYHPLSEQDTVKFSDLKRGAEQLLPAIEKVVQKYNKPVLLTEVGFTSTAKNWLSPHERKRGARPYLEDQAMCYRATFEAFWDKDWLHGFYWWKWPTYLEYGGERHSGFTPNGKPAEEVVKTWYSKRRTIANAYRSAQGVNSEPQ